MFNHPLLGYTTNTQEALHLINDTGYFYLVICFSFLFFFLFLYKKSPAVREMQKTHLTFIILWGIAGFMLINSLLVTFCTFIISVFACRNLWFILRVSGILGIVTISLPSLNPTLKHHHYFQELQKQKITPNILVSCSQINEFILWTFIVYRSLITLRAALTLYS